MINVGKLTEEHLIAGIQWISKMSARERWNLTEEEVARLLKVEPVTFQEMQREASNAQPIVLTGDSLERLSLLLNIWKSLSLFVPSGRQDLAFDWFSNPTKSERFDNKSIKDFLLESDNVESFYAVINYLRGQN